MTKRFLAYGLVLFVMATTNAYASRARLLVFGTGDSGLILGDNGNMGSFYSDDAYNIFINPAYINDYKNFGVIEKSNFNSAYTLGNYTAANPTGTFNAQSGGVTAEGGFVSSFGTYSLGMFMNRTDVLSDAIYAHPFDMRPIDIMFGGETTNAWKWGVGATYASYQSTPLNSTGLVTDTDVVVRLGLEHNNLEPFAWYRIGGNNHFTPVGTEKNKMYALGLKYHWGEWTPFAAFKKTQLQDTNTGTTFGGGFGRNTILTEGVKLAYSLAFFRQASADNFGFSTANRGELNPQRSVVPINVAVEGDAASWITLRAGLSYNLVDETSTGTTPDSTSGRIGASLHAGKLDFDWAIGKRTGGGTETANDANSQDFDFSNGFFTAAALDYHW